MDQERHNDDDMEVERDPKTGASIVVRSERCNQRSPLRFTNKTNEWMQVMWIDYSGHYKDYKVISPTGWVDVNTYTTHPWVFWHPATKERFTINGMRVFRAPGPMQMRGQLVRVNYPVYKPVRSLRYASMVSIATQLKSVDTIVQLELPLTVALDLRTVVEQFMKYENATRGTPQT